MGPTTVFITKQIVIAVLISIGIAVAYSAFALGIAAYLHKNGERYKEIE